MLRHMRVMDSPDSPPVWHLLEAVETDLIYLNNHLWWKSQKNDQTFMKLIKLGVDSSGQVIHGNFMLFWIVI